MCFGVVKIWCIIFVVLIGNVFEWFDLIVYGFFVVMIVKLFFFVMSEVMLLMLMFGMFGLFYLIWLIGGFVFGVYVDCVGCKVLLLLLIVMMMVGMLLIVLMLIYVLIGIFVLFGIMLLWLM